MKFLANAVRYILNINSIWGLMILISFGLCVVQHYLPTTTMLPAELFVEGENHLVIRTEEREGKVNKFEYQLTLGANGLTIPAESQKPNQATPWLISAERIKDTFLLKWDYSSNGDYKIALRRFRPLDSLVPSEEFDKGENVVVLRCTATDGKKKCIAYSVTKDKGKLSLPDEAFIMRHDRPGLVDAEISDDGVKLTWADLGEGSFEVAVDRVIRAGKLVTLQSLTDAAIDYAGIGFKIALGLVATMVLFLGLMKVGEEAGIVQVVARVFYPVIRYLFPDVPKDHPANGAILMNVTTTILGLGNAATPFGLKAMKQLQTLNPTPEVASDSQVMLLGYNTAGLALLPTTLIALRKSAGCANPFEIIGTCMFAGAVSTLVAIIMVKVLGKLPMFSYRAAAAEYSKEKQAEAAKASLATEAPSGEDG